MYWNLWENVLILYLFTIITIRFKHSSSSSIILFIYSFFHRSTLEFASLAGNIFKYSSAFKMSGKIHPLHYSTSLWKKVLFRRQYRRKITSSKISGDSKDSKATTCETKIYPLSNLERKEWSSSRSESVKPRKTRICEDQGKNKEKHRFAIDGGRVTSGISRVHRAFFVDANLNSLSSVSYRISLSGIVDSPPSLPRPCPERSAE